jgi:hypothetical protein
MTLTKTKSMYFTTTILSVLTLALFAVGPINNAEAGGNDRIEFDVTDTPGHWFDTGSDIAGTRSLAVSTPDVEVKFRGESNTVHTYTSLLFPTGAANMPFWRLLAFTCLHARFIHTCLEQ